MIATQQSIVIGLGEFAVTSDISTLLVCVGLGSCIALCVYDPIARVGGLAHMVLPSRRPGDETSQPTKFVDSGTALLLQRTIKAGAMRSRLVAKIVGGARMLTIPGAQYHLLDIGQRNIDEMRATLTRERLRLAGTELGGTSGRSVQFSVETGLVTVKVAGGQVTQL